MAVTTQIEFKYCALSTDILVDGEYVGFISPTTRGEHIVYFKAIAKNGTGVTHKQVARFKYLNTAAKSWIKFILKHYTPEQVIAPRPLAERAAF